LDDFARFAAEERNEVIAEAASRLGLDPIAVEKDFWVCWVLDKLFKLPGDHPDLLFKGGTSLSKAFGLIHRFSEDIDLTVSRYSLGYDGDRDPEFVARKSSRNAGQRMLEDLAETCRTYVEDTLLVALRGTFSELLGEPDSTWQLSCDPNERQNLIFSYPTILDTRAYVAPIVLIECGARSDLTPAQETTVRPYLADVIPEAFSRPEALIKAVLAPERTFLEKLLLLHEEYHRPDPKDAKRLSRHYYDVAVLSASSVATDAVENEELFARVREHKSFYFSSAWRRYDLAKPGSLRLVPHEELTVLLRRDYEEMAPMFFAEPVRPSFDEVIEALAVLEGKINA